MGLKYFFQLASLLLGYKTRNWNQMVSEIQVEAIATILIIFGAHMHMSAAAILGYQLIVHSVNSV